MEQNVLHGHLKKIKIQYLLNKILLKKIKCYMKFGFIIIKVKKLKLMFKFNYINFYNLIYIDILNIKSYDKINL